jgi:flagellin-like protein
MKCDIAEKFLGENGVSAVIGVILMVAITVAVAATMYVYIGDIASIELKTPTVQMFANENGDRLSVINTDGEVYWDGIALRSTGNVTIYINGEVNATIGEAVIADTYCNVNDSMVDGDSAHVLIHSSDFIDIEANASTTLSDITITIIHDDTGIVLGTYAFSSIAIVGG